MIAGILRATTVFVAVAALAGGIPTSAAPAPDDHSVLIFGPSVSGFGGDSLEAQVATELGLTPVTVDAGTWASMSASDFASYRALVFGDAFCEGSDDVLDPAVDNSAVWGPVITGNVVINVTDPVFHQGQGGRQLTKSSINFAADDDTTGVYISLSCYYHEVSDSAPVEPGILTPFGDFLVYGAVDFAGCPNDAHIVAVHPALEGLTDANLSNWSCSAHGGFAQMPSNFNVLAIMEDNPGDYVASDGSTGTPYIIARGEEVRPIACGDGERAGDEECDDGNLQDGDGCSSTCRLEGECVPEPEICDNNVDDDCDQLIDEQDEEDCEPVLVVLTSFTATPADQAVTLDWSTALETDNAGFYLLRRNRVTDALTRLNTGLIPAQGDVAAGASYRYVDLTAVNGVSYDYVLVDVELSGAETRHPGAVAVANPLRPDVRLLAPAYGDRGLTPGTRPTFQWEGLSGRGTLMISADPTFPRDRTMSVRIDGRRGQGQVTLSPRHARVMETMAAASFGVVYWKIVEPTLGSTVRTSATFMVGYDLDRHTARVTVSPIPVRPGLKARRR